MAGLLGGGGASSALQSTEVQGITETMEEMQGIFQGLIQQQLQDQQEAMNIESYQQWVVHAPSGTTWNLSALDTFDERSNNCRTFPYRWN